ncbi:hypothetical protein [Candidatus Accumulibacter sp. ACC012]|uniref:hypothetical protein n=1 Tax=Candidatus Accumulibacter sp. ACC012 TaxID=2823332 RepID=UPI0034190644
MKAPAQFVDQRQVRRSFARAAASYDEVAVLQREIASRMLARLDYVRIEPAAHSRSRLRYRRQPSPPLHARYPGALLIGADFCENMLRASQASRSRLRWLMPFLRRQRTPLLAADAARCRSRRSRSACSGRTSCCTGLTTRCSIS